MSSTLIMHVDSHRRTGVTAAQLRDLLVNPATDTHIPIGHAVVRDLVAEQIESVGLEIVNEQIGVSTEKEIDFGDDGVHAVHQKAFGTFDVRGLDYAIDGDATAGLSVGWRNSMNKQLPAAVVVGSRVFVCDNLCFSGEVMLKRRHTLNILRDLPNLVAAAFGKIEALSQRQFAIYDRLREIAISDDEAAGIVAQACAASGKAFLARKNVIPILDVYGHDFATDAERDAGILYNRDQHGHGTAWALFNAGTCFAHQFLARSYVDASTALLPWHNVFVDRFARDLTPTDKVAVSMSDVAVIDEPEPEPEPVAEQDEPATEPVDDLYDPADEQDAIGGYDPDEYEEV